MLKNYYHLLLLTIAAAFILTAPAFSQSIYFYEPDISEFPTVKVRLQAQNAVGNPFQLVNTDFDVKENGESMNETVNIDCSPKPDTPAVAVIVMIDVSGSMTEELAPDSDQTKIEWAKYALRKFVDSLFFINGTRVAFVAYEGANRLHRPYQFSADALYDFIDGSNPPKTLGTGDTYFKRAFLGPDFNTVNYIGETPEDMFRHIIIISDTEEDVNHDFTVDDIDNISAQLKAKKTMVHALLIEKNLHSWNFGGICEQTGGKQYDKIKSLYDLTTAIEFLAGYIQRQDYCVLEYTAPFGCDEASKSRTYEIRNSKDQDQVETRSYTAPEESLVKFELDNEEMIFGLPDDGIIEQSFTIDYQGPEMTVKKMNFSETGYFSFVDFQPPLTLKNGDSKTINVKYILEDPAEPTEVMIDLQSDDYLCGDLPDITLISGCSAQSAELFEFGTVMQYMEDTQTIADAFMNDASVPLEVTMEIKGSHASDYSLSQATATVPPGEGLDVDVTFKPTVDGGVREAYIEYTYLDACGGTETTRLTGEAEVNSVEEELTGEGNALRLRAEPNPAKENISISFETPVQGAKLELYNSMGSLVETLLDKNIFSGSYRADYDVSGLAPGVYILRLQSGSHFESFRLVVAR